MLRHTRIGRQWKRDNKAFAWDPLDYAQTGWHRRASRTLRHVAQSFNDWDLVRGYVDFERSVGMEVLQYFAPCGDATARSVLAATQLCFHFDRFLVLIRYQKRTTREHDRLELIKPVVIVIRVFTRSCVLSLFCSILLCFAGRSSNKTLSLQTPKGRRTCSIPIDGEWIGLLPYELCVPDFLNLGSPCALRPACLFKGCVRTSHSALHVLESAKEFSPTDVQLLQISSWNQR